MEQKISLNSHSDYPLTKLYIIDLVFIDQSERNFPAVRLIFYREYVKLGAGIPLIINAKVTVLKTSETTFRIIDSRSNLNLASRMHLFDFIRPNILNNIFTA